MSEKFGIKRSKNIKDCNEFNKNLIASQLFYEKF